MEIATKKINARISTIAKSVIINDLELRNQLSELLDVQDRMIVAYLRDNEWNNRLTLIGAINLIAEKTGLTKEQIIETNE